MKAKLNELQLTFTEIQLDLYETKIRDEVKTMTGSATGIIYFPCLTVLMT